MNLAEQLEEKADKRSGTRRRFSPFGFGVVIALVILAIGLSGCGGSDDSGSDSNGGGDAPSSDSVGGGDSSGGGDNADSGDSGDSGSDADADSGDGDVDASAGTLAALLAAGNDLASLTRYQVNFEIEIEGQAEQTGFIRVDGENVHMSFGEFELIAADGSTFIQVGGAWQELPGAAGAGALAGSPFSPADITGNINDIEGLDVDGVEINEAGSVDLPNGSCTAYNMVVSGQPGSITWCLRSSGEVAQMVLDDGEMTTVTMTFSYDDIEVMAP